MVVWSGVGGRRAFYTPLMSAQCSSEPESSISPSPMLKARAGLELGVSPPQGHLGSGKIVSFEGRSC